MNRERKFRGKVLDPIGNNSADWPIGDLVHELSTGKTFIVDLAHFNENTKLTNVMIEVDPSTVGQFTDSTDEDKREIYEDDVIRYMTEDGEVYHAVVKFKADDTTENTPFLSGFTVEVIKCVTDEYEKEIEANEAIGLKVIGNIHDNTESKEGI